MFFHHKSVRPGLCQQLRLLRLHWALPAVFSTTEESNIATIADNAKGTNSTTVGGAMFVYRFEFRADTRPQSLKLRGTPAGIFMGLWRSFISVTGMKFPIWTQDKMRPAYRASPVTELIWRGPVAKTIGIGSGRGICVKELEILLKFAWMTNFYFLMINIQYQ